MTMISNRERKEYLDQILSKLVGYAQAMNNAFVEEGKQAEEQAKSALYKSIETLVMGIYQQERAVADSFFDGCLMRAVRYTKGDFAACSGATFRKWAIDELQYKYLVNVGAYSKPAASKAKHTIKDGDTVRPMTEEEIKQWQENRLKKLQEQLAKLQAEMAA